MRKSLPKSASHNTSMALHRPPQVNFFGSKVDRPAKNKISAVQRLIITTTVKWSLHQASNDVLNKYHEMPQARNRAVSFLTKSQMKLLKFSPRPWQKTVSCWNHDKSWKIENFYFSRKSLRKPPEGLWRPLKGSGRFREDFRAWTSALEKFEKVHRRVLRTTRRWRSIDRPK